MQYRALYRKYRPMLFTDVVGQEGIVRTLKNTIKEQKISHAYLFSGSRGTGKTSVAKLFSKAVNCSFLSFGDACNECEVCRSIIENRSSDVIEIDAASNNGVDEIRELKNKVNFVPGLAKYKVYIIDEVHMLSIAAFNALLKTLEEPPAHVIFILATTEIHKLPLTIISRCQNFSFNKINEEKMSLKLNEIIEKENIKIKESAIKEIARLSDGGMRDAIGMLEQVSALIDEEILDSHIHLIAATIPKEKICYMLTKIFEGDIASLFVEVEKLYYEGKDFLKIVEEIIVFLRDLVLFKRLPKRIKDIDKEKIASYQYLLGCVDEGTLYNSIEEASLALGNMRTSTHPKILFEIFLLKISKVDNDEKKIIQYEKKVKVENDEKIVIQEKVIKIPIEDKKEKPKETNIQKEKDIKKILINNTLALAKKECLKEANEKWTQLKTYLLNKDLKRIAIMLLDVVVVASSEERMILTCKYEALVEKLDDEIKDISALISKVMGRKYDVVCVEENEWRKLREYYVDMKKANKKIELMPEFEKNDNITHKKNKKEKLSFETKSAIDIFGEEIIEMKG